MENKLDPLIIRLETAISGSCARDTEIPWIISCLLPYNYFIPETDDRGKPCRELGDRRRSHDRRIIYTIKFYVYCHSMKYRTRSHGHTIPSVGIAVCIQISRRHVARDSLAYFEDDKVVIYILVRPRRVAISLQSNWPGIKSNVPSIMNYDISMSIRSNNQINGYNWLCFVSNIISWENNKLTQSFGYEI